MKILVDNSKLGWLAGIIDGEGCIGFYKRKPKDNLVYTPELSICNTSLEIINEVNNIIESLLDDNSGVKTYSHKRNNPKHKQIYFVSVTGYNLPRLLEKLIPYLIFKKERAKLMIKFKMLRENEIAEYKKSHRGGRPTYSEQSLRLIELVYKLNKRGI